MTNPGRSLALLLAFGMLLTTGAMPTAAGDEGDEEDSTGCLNLVLSRFSPGLVFNAALGVNAVGITLASHQPDSGYQAAIVIVPSVCAIQALLPIHDIEKRLTDLEKQKSQSSSLTGPPALP